MLSIRNPFKPGGSGEEKTGVKKRLSPKQTRLLVVVLVVVVAALCIAAVLIVQNRPPVETGSVDPSVTSADTLTEDQYYKDDIFASATSSGEYTATILPQTPDAGVSYVTDTLFIGDSNTAGMILNSSTTNVTMNNGIGIVSMGISHVLTLKCVKFAGMSAVTVPEAIKIMQPRRIVVEYGTNDYYLTPEKFAETYSAALDAITAAYPYADIIIGSIFPITANCSYYTVSMPIVEKFNVELVKLAQEKNVHFLNWSEALKDPVTGYCKPEYMSGDGVHLSKAGMEQIFNYFRTHKLDGDDRRPMPLNPIPAREATPAGLLGSGPRTPVEEPAPVTQNLVTVTFTAGTGGSISGGSSFTVAPGTTVGPVTAVPAAGYKFAGWSGGSASGASVTFTVPANATPGQTFVISASFKKIDTSGGDGSTTGGDSSGSTPGGDGSGGTPGGGDTGGGSTPGGGDTGGGSTPGGGDTGGGSTPGGGDTGGGGTPGDGSGGGDTPTDG